MTTQERVLPTKPGEWLVRYKDRWAVAEVRTWVQVCGVGDKPDQWQHLNGPERLVAQTVRHRVMAAVDQRGGSWDLVTDDCWLWVAEVNDIKAGAHLVHGQHEAWVGREVARYMGKDEGE